MTKMRKEGEEGGCMRHKFDSHIHSGGTDKHTHTINKAQYKFKDWGMAKQVNGRHVGLTT